MIKIGLIREGEIPADNRVALTPPQCKWIHKNAPQIKVVAQSSPDRCFTDKEYQIAGVQVVDGGTVGMDLLDTLAGCDHLLICDAVKIGAPPGSVVKLVDGQVPALFQTRYSPHQLGLSEVLATLTLTDEAPAVVTLIGIVPADLELGIDLSPPVAAAIQPALEQLAATLAELGLPLTPVYGA